jgi:hypothetical protein
LLINATDLRLSGYWSGVRRLKVPPKVNSNRLLVEHLDRAYTLIDDWFVAMRVQVHNRTTVNEIVATETVDNSSAVTTHTRRQEQTLLRW